ncbi:Glycosyl transferases group 1 [Paenibacillus algorifonticola]|uniref:Glycosyl transferases group 1 n=1 Tax=Paenibacillus algorifonticola TaxID=684063 RepID=A0A1I1Y700_9BACL|nr:glycosyltransferase family 4 protein [Paenibacillus algorifonticola]SFE15425.1 Glycosyl transferases group 1 [Paenibacillus algorifonticola]
MAKSLKRKRYQTSSKRKLHSSSKKTLLAKRRKRKAIKPRSNRRAERRRKSNGSLRKTKKRASSNLSKYANEAGQAEAHPAAKEIHDPQPWTAQGINLIGFIHAEMGIGESARLAARAIERADIPFGILNFPLQVATRMSDMSWAHKKTEERPFNINLLHMNADYMIPAMDHFGRSLFHNRYNIGYWHWELPDFPEEFVPAFKLVQEVWVASRFVLDSVVQKSPVPVVVIPHGVEVEVSPEVTRESLGLPTDRFLFTMMYDVQSYTHRKNPQAVVEAFRLAFPKNDPSVGLVLKVNNMNFRPEDMESLLQLAAEYNNIYIIDRIFSRLEVNTLLNVTDCFVSLHRAEGFGLGLAEAMYLGKPVIGTNWSGNTDFMNETNSCPVNYELVQVGTDWGPYQGYQTWAEPNVHHAALYMQKLLKEPEWREAIAAQGQHTIHTSFSPQVVGSMIRSRLTELSLL